MQVMHVKGTAPGASLAWRSSPFCSVQPNCQGAFSHVANMACVPHCIDALRPRFIAQNLDRWTIFHKIVASRCGTGTCNRRKTADFAEGADGRAAQANLIHLPDSDDSFDSWFSLPESAPLRHPRLAGSPGRQKIPEIPETKGLLVPPLELSRTPFFCQGFTQWRRSQLVGSPDPRHTKTTPPPAATPAAACS